MAGRTREDFAQVGLDLLAEAGIRGVTVSTVCDRLGVTTGSFYHHFRGVPDLRGAMLEHWEQKYARDRPAAVRDLPPLERLDALIEASIDREHAIENALRDWSRTDPDAAAVQRRLDELRIAFTAETLEACGVPAARARVLAVSGLAMLIGYQNLAEPIGHDETLAAADEWRSHLHRVIEESSFAASRHPSREPVA